MATTDFTTKIFVDQSPQEVFDAINNVRGWWSEEIEGSTDKLNDEFSYHYKDLHRCKMKLIEVVPGKKVVWLVLDNYFNFTKDKSEWKDTKISFEIFKKDNQTQLRFTHIGLVPQYECFDVCKDAWSNYIRNSLHNLITTGKGEPNPKEGDGFNSQIVEKWKLQEGQSFTTSFLVEQSPEEAFDAINNVRGWWTENLEGSSQKLNDEFAVQFGEVHYSKQKLIEVIPGKKVVWRVTESKLNFLEDKSEWTNSHISFEVLKKGSNTEVRFTHLGLVPDIECYDACSNAWSDYINNSLRNLISTGKGEPTLKDG